MLHSLSRCCNWSFGGSKTLARRKDHDELPVHTAQASQYSLSRFAYQLDRESAGAAFGRNSMLGKSSGAQFAGQGRSNLPSPMILISFWFACRYAGDRHSKRALC